MDQLLRTLFNLANIITLIVTVQIKGSERIQKYWIFFKLVKKIGDLVLPHPLYCMELFARNIKKMFHICKFSFSICPFFTLFKTNLSFKT